MRKILGLLICLCVFNYAEAQTVTLETDFTDGGGKRKGFMGNLFNTFNRVTPVDGINPPSGENNQFALVRPLGGGVQKNTNGTPRKVGETRFVDFQYDTFKYNANTRTYYTDFKHLTKQILQARSNGTLDLLVLNNLSWAFQRDANNRLPLDKDGKRNQQQLQLIPSAKDIQQLLSNIGAAHRCSQSTIETLIQKRNSSSNNVNNNLSADEMIDLIAQIRSI